MRFLLYILSLFLLISCGSDRRAGATTETTNGITIALSHQNLPYSARVVLYDSGLNPLDTGYTNAHGNLTLNYPAAISSLNIEAHNQDSSLMLWEKLSHPTRTVRLFIDSAASVTLYSPSGVADTVRLAHTPYIGERQGASYIFRRLPAGSFTVISSNREGSVDSMGLITLQAGRTLDTIWSIQPAIPRLLLEDFDDGDNKHRYASRTNTQGWYLNTENGASWLQPLSAGAFSEALYSTNAWSGKSLRLKFSLNEGTAIFGTHLGTDSNAYDFSSLSAIRLRLRGNARLDLALEQPTQPVPGKFRKTLWSVQTSERWQEFALTASDAILDSSQWNLPLDSVKNSVALLSFFIRSGDSLDIDELILEGIDSSVFNP